MMVLAAFVALGFHCGSNDSQSLEMKKLNKGYLELGS